MAAINALITRDETLNQLVKRQNWAAREPGVIVVFCIVGVVAIGMIALMVSKAITRRRNSKPSEV